MEFSPILRYNAVVARTTSNSPPFPPGYRPIVTFDTSVHNRLMDDSAGEAVLARIRGNRHVRIAGLSIEELASTTDATERKALFTYAQHVTQDNESDCLLPHNELIRRLILDHYHNPWSFDWRNVDVRSWDYHGELSNREYVMDDALATDQRQQQKDLQKQFRQMFTTLRPKLDLAFANHGTPRPLTFRDALKGDKEGNQTLTVSMGRMFYIGITGAKVSRNRVREFIEVCPPYRAMLYGMMMARYDLAVRDMHRGERFQCGRNDLFMAVYLPYCDEFVTDEKRREQERCLREIAAVANVPTKVLSYDDFYNSLAIT
jgi:hypothetical protein